MMSQSLKILDPENSVLFLGSGFSAEAINIKGEEIPVVH